MQLTWHDPNLQKPWDVKLIWKDVIYSQDVVELSEEMHDTFNLATVKISS